MTTVYMLDDDETGRRAPRPLTVVAGPAPTVHVTVGAPHGRGGPDVFSLEAERLWLPMLSPTGYLLLRRLLMVGATPDRTIRLDELSRQIGAGPNWAPNRSTIRNTLARMAHFQQIGYSPHGPVIRVFVRPDLPPLTDAQRSKYLTAELRDEYRQYMTSKK